LNSNARSSLDRRTFGLDLSPGFKAYADGVGIPTSTVRYYERIGLLPVPARTPSGYREYGDESAARLLFITRARHIGLSCAQIGEVLPIWDGVNCSATHQHVSTLIEAKRAEIRERIAELQRFAEQLDDVGQALEDSPPPAACLPDLSCCMPETDGAAPIALMPTKRE
jgi:DNA-binding transcriptional MerR regulator